MDKLSRSHVAVFGVGGVGGFVCEALARCGVGKIDLIDNDEVNLSNLNRQIIATMDTVGKPKVEVMKERILSINPDAVVNTYQCFFVPENSGEFDFKKYDYVVDAIDTVAAKLELVVRCKEAGTPIICSMGTGNKLDPTRFRIADISKTSVDPLARVIRRELRNRGITKLKVLFSEEEPIKVNVADYEEGSSRRSIPASIAFVPSVAGLIIAGEVIKDLAGIGKA